MTYITCMDDTRSMIYRGDWMTSSSIDMKDYPRAIVGIPAFVTFAAST